VAAAYALAALAWFPRARARAQAARLEARLARQGFTDDALALCLGPDHNLWSKSLVVDAVRRARQVPTPGALRSAAWERRIAQLAHEQFAPLRPTRLDLTGLLLIALALVWETTGAGAVALGLAIGLEALTHLTRHHVHARLHLLERGLASALSGPDTPLASPLIRPAPRGRYAHVRLYRTSGVQTPAA
jgi:hypothetical protein